MRIITHNEMTKLAIDGEYVEISKEEAEQRISEKLPVWGTEYYYVGYPDQMSGSDSHYRSKASIWENGSHNHTDADGTRAPHGQVINWIDTHYWKQAEK